jgi:hypothetical protein
VIATYSKVKYEGSGMDTGASRFRNMRDDPTRFRNEVRPGILYEYIYIYMTIYKYEYIYI